MSMTTIDQIDIGQTIRFTTINPHDNIVWEGKVIAFCDYNIARMISDIDAYFQEIQRSQVSVEDKTALQYIVLSVDENQTGVYTKRVFSTTWIEPSSLEVVDVNLNVDIRIYDVSKEKIEDIIQLLRSTGYQVSILASN